MSEWIAGLAVARLSAIARILSTESNIKAKYDGNGCVYRYSNNAFRETPRRDYGRPRIDWQVQLLAGTPAPTSLECSGEDGDEPDWLKNVLALARVAGKVMDMPHPPPSVVVWFETTPDGVFVKFYEW